MKCRKGYEIKVCHSYAGYYIGTDIYVFPNCRISNEYYKTEELAQTTLDSNTFAQRNCVENKLCNGNKPCIKEKL